MVLRSPEFDDIYFSVQDGLAETRHVFLEGNGLPAAWRDRADFTIAETGFGTGLNFLSAWKLFEETASPEQRLHFISVEKYPLARDEISRALQPWAQLFGGRLERLRNLYPLRVPGFHRLNLSRQVSLTLIFDDVNRALPELDAPRGVDAWFLDGFTPAKNPGMWTPEVFAEMARLSHRETTLATFTVASAVRQGLSAAGFAVEKQRGFGRKRQMLAGRFTLGNPRPTMPPVKRMAIIGAGLAGTAVAHVLREQGQAPVLFEAMDHIAGAASGNVEGMFNPRLSARRTDTSDFYTAAFALGVREFADIQSRAAIGFNPCGSLHLMTDDERARKFAGAGEQWGWPATELRLLNAAEASQMAGIPLPMPALYLPAAGTVSPARLCQHWAAQIPIRLSTPVNEMSYVDGQWRVANEEFDAVILAGGSGLPDFPAAAALPFQRVRGQLTEIATTPALAPLQTNLCFGGYLSPQQNGRHTLGATFQRWLDDPAARPEDDADNLARLAAVLPGLPTPTITNARVGFRLASRDHFPVIGALAGPPGLYISGAHGSHGIIAALAGAQLLADMIGERPRSLSRGTIDALDPKRFKG